MQIIKLEGKTSFGRFTGKVSYILNGTTTGPHEVKNLPVDEILPPDDKTSYTLIYEYVE